MTYGLSSRGGAEISGLFFQNNLQQFGNNLLLLLLLLLVTVNAAAETFYKSIDANGRISYSDKKPNNAKAEQIIVPKLPTVTAESVNVPAVVPPQVPAQPIVQQQKQGHRYKTLSISTPKQEQTFWNTADIPVVVQVEPELKPGHLLALTLDGQLVEAASKKTVFVVNTEDRGEHQLVAKIMDNDNKQLQASQPVVFFLQRSTVNVTPSARSSKKLSRMPG